MSQLLFFPEHRCTAHGMQVLGVTILATGVTFRCEDAGKACQAAVRYPAAAFDDFAFSGSPSTFCVQLAGLAAALRGFAALEAPVRVTECAAHLVLETTAAEVDDDGAAVAMYAHVTIVESQGTRCDLADHWRAPTTEFVCAGGLLREAVDDLEWPQGHAHVSVSGQPLQVCALLLAMHDVVLTKAGSGRVFSHG